MSWRIGIGDIIVDTLEFNTKGKLSESEKVEAVCPFAIDELVFARSVTVKREFEENPTTLFKIIVWGSLYMLM